MKGYVCLISRIHAVELHDLPETDALGFMQDAQRVSRALAATTGAVKLNYEIHGNTLPHLHMHLFPRYRGDMFEGGPIDPKTVRQPVYAEGEFAALRALIVKALDHAASPRLCRTMTALPFPTHRNKQWLCQHRPSACRRQLLRPTQTNRLPT